MEDSGSGDDTIVQAAGEPERATTLPGASSPTSWQELAVVVRDRYAWP